MRWTNSNANTVILKHWSPGHWRHTKQWSTGTWVMDVKKPTCKEEKPVKSVERVLRMQALCGITCKSFILIIIRSSQRKLSRRRRRGCAQCAARHTPWPNPRWQSTSRSASLRRRASWSTFVKCAGAVLQRFTNSAVIGQSASKTKAKNKKCPHENCDYVTRTKMELENHVRQYHLNLPIEKNHICNHCGKAYNLLYQLKQHIKAVHLEIRPFICNECGRTFARKDKLQDHIDLHKGLFKYKCPFCQKGLNNSGALCNHKRICTLNPDRFASLNDARIARERSMPPAQPAVPPPKMYF